MEGLLYSGGLSVLANFEFRLAVTVVFIWRFTVKKSSRRCRKLQLLISARGFRILLPFACLVAIFPCCSIVVNLEIA